MKSPDVESSDFTEVPNLSVPIQQSTTHSAYPRHIQPPNQNQHSNQMQPPNLMQAPNQIQPLNQNQFIMNVANRSKWMKIGGFFSLIISVGTFLTIVGIINISTAGHFDNPTNNSGRSVGVSLIGLGVISLLIGVSGLFYAISRAKQIDLNGPLPVYYQNTIQTGIGPQVSLGYHQQSGYIQNPSYAPQAAPVISGNYVPLPPVIHPNQQHGMPGGSQETGYNTTLQSNYDYTLNSSDRPPPYTS